MRQYSRQFPLFSLCGLKCGLCPRFHTEGSSRCPGCGGESFYEIHPTCGVITCSGNHGGIEYCYLCSEYPCRKYEKPSPTDSFITYRPVLEDFEWARKDMHGFQREIEERVTLLRRLIETCNDGRSKSFYCTALNLLPLSELNRRIQAIERECAEMPVKDRAERMKESLTEVSVQYGIDLKLRKQDRPDR